MPLIPKVSIIANAWIGNALESEISCLRLSVPASALQGGAGIESVGALRPDNSFTMVLIQEVLILKCKLKIEFSTSRDKWHAAGMVKKLVYVKHVSVLSY